MAETLSERLQNNGLWPFEAYVRDYVTMSQDNLDRRMARRGITLKGQIPQGIVAATSSVCRSDGTQLDSRAVLMALLETGVYVYDWALNRAKVIPMRELTFSGWSPYDETAEVVFPEIPFTRTNLWATAVNSAKQSGISANCFAVAATVAGIAHSLGFFPDELREWAADVTTRFLNLADDVLVLECLRPK